MTIDQAGWLYSHWSLLCENLLFSILTLGSLSQGLQPPTDMAAARVRPGGGTDKPRAPGGTVELDLQYSNQPFYLF